jgi:urease accessory protein
MYASDWSSEVFPAAPPRRQRAHGRINFEVARSGELTRVVRLAEGGPCRVRLPNVTGTNLEAVMMNTGGGIACGDRIDIRVEAGEGARLTMTTPAAERCYKSDGAVAEIAVDLSIATSAHLAWLPQETILYDHARVRRRFTADLAADATLSMFEALVFGRTARGEQVTQGLLEDTWRVRRAGRLVYADTLRLDGPVSELLARPAIAGGNAALATFLHVAPDAALRLDEARGLLDGAGCACGASAWNGLLAVRFLAPDIGTLRRTATGFLTGFLGPLPRVWHG